MNASESRARALLSLAVSMFAFGTIGIFRRQIPLSSGLLAFVRGLLGGSFLLLLQLIKSRSSVLPDKENSSLLSAFGGGKRLSLLILSGAFIGFNWILLFEAYNYTTIATATLCYYMQPALVVIGAAVLFREALPPAKLLCVLLAFAGMYLVSGAAENGIPGPGELKGVLFGLGAAVLYAAVVLLNKGIGGIDPYKKTTVQLFSAAAVLFPWLLATGGFSSVHLTVTSTALLLIVCIVHTGFCYALYFGALEKLPSHTAALFGYIDPVTAILLSALLLGEHLTLHGILGTILILGSTLAAELLF